MINDCTFRFRVRQWLATLAILTLILPLTLSAASKPLEPPKDYGLIARVLVGMLSSEHYNHHQVDNKTSNELFNEYLKFLDPNKMYFTIKDVDSLQPYYDKLDDDLKAGDLTFAYDAFNIFMEKVKKRETFAKSTLSKGFDFTVDEVFEFDRATAPWAASEEQLDDVWRKKLKNDILTLRLMERASKDEESEAKKEEQAAPAQSGNADEAKKKVPLAQKPPEERIQKRLEAHRRHMDDFESMDVLELYLSCLSRVYDPHTSYMSPRAEDDFNISMRLSLFGIGAVLTSEEGYTKVEKIIPGGPADKDGRLKHGDRITAVTQGEDGEPVDVVDMPLNKVVDKIRGPKGTKVKLSVLEASKGAQAIPVDVVILRDEVKLKDSEATGEVREFDAPAGGKLRLGIIKLPSFYCDFEGVFKNKKDFKSSTKDVKAILEKFTKDGVDGVLIDLRSNPGGSLKEAIELTGLFIDKGPVVQVRATDGDVRVEDDTDSSCYYNGPLVLLVNRLSASAAEIFAGAIQDYGRGIIVGEKQTHGKGTVQTVYELSNILSRLDLHFKPGSVKLTSAKFYRINGGSTQNKGVIPDICFDSFTDYMEIGESKLEHAMPWDQINPVEFKSKGTPQQLVPELVKKSIERRAQSPEFQRLAKAIETFKELKEKKTVSLNEAKRWQEYQNEKAIAKERESILKKRKN